jgi:hypothetical protein
MRKALYERNKLLLSPTPEILNPDDPNKRLDLSSKDLFEASFFSKVCKSFDGFASDQFRKPANSFVEDEGLKGFLMQNERNEKKSKNSLKRLSRNSFQAELVPDFLDEVTALDVNILYNVNQEFGDGNELVQRFGTLRSITKNNKKRFSLKSLSCHDLENISLKHIKISKNSEILMFFIPFMKNNNDFIDYRFTSIDSHYFECFCKNYDEFEEKVKSEANGFMRLIERFPNRWTDGIVPFVIEKNLMFVSNPNNENIYSIVFKSMRTVESQTIIRFVKYNPKGHTQFLNFSLDKMNSSYLGASKGKNQITLSCRAIEADVLHQLMHSFGFMHMHQKLNDESFDYISRANVKNANHDGHACFYGLKFGPFDADSVLMWPSCENMISSTNDEYKPATQLSKFDSLKVNFFYDNSNLNLSDEELRHKYKAFKKEAEILKQ